MAHELSLDDVHHIARLARLRLSDDEAHAYRAQLSAVLDHVRMLQQLDVEGVEPMARPRTTTNRLADDVPAPPLPREVALANAPAVEGPFVAVPKVLSDGVGTDA